MVVGFTVAESPVGWLGCAMSIGGATMFSTLTMLSAAWPPWLSKMRAVTV